MRAAVQLLPLLATLTLSAPVTAGADGELLMFEQEFCPWCEAWEQEVGPIYPKTFEGRLLPLRRVDIEDPVPVGVKLSEPVRYTPTFVVLEDGVEVGRVTGYAGEFQFWGLLGELAGRLETADTRASR